MEYTLLEIVQRILSSLNSDEVDSISDTAESQQVADIVKEVYYNLLSLQEWKHLQKSFKLDGSGSITLPTKMIVPEDITNINWIKYRDGSNKFVELTYVSPEEFVEITMNYDSNIQEMTDGDNFFNIKIDKEPEYWTTFDDNIVYFDSFNKSRQSTMESSDSYCYGTKIPVFSMDDTFVPDLPADGFSYLMSEAKSVAFVEINQQVNSKAEQHSRRGRYRMNYADGNLKRQRSRPDYGRK